MYGPDPPPTHWSPIDHRKVRFLRAFGVINFLPDDAPDARYANVGLAVHARLQLEVDPSADTISVPTEPRRTCRHSTSPAPQTSSQAPNGPARHVLRDRRPLPHLGASTPRTGR
jgi:hypothetical protein